MGTLNFTVIHDATVYFGKVVRSYNSLKRYFNVEDKFVWVLGLKKGKNLEWRIKIRCDSVVHKDELTLWW